MNNIFDMLLRTLINTPISLINVICWNQCLNKENSKYKIIITTILIDIFTCIFNYSFSKSIRIFLVFIPLIIINYLLISKKLDKAIMSVIISQLILWVVEFSFAIPISIVFGNSISKFMSSITGFICINIYITITYIIIINKKIPLKIYNKINKSLNSIKNNETVLYLIIIILIISISTVESYMKLSLPIVLITNLITGIIFIGIVIKFTTVKSRYNKISGKYQTSLTSLREYEELIDKFSINNHENKNELLTIRNMIKDKKVTSYIDKIIDNKIKDNEKNMRDTTKIPEGGLRATIYSKLCLMDKYKIKYKLYIAKDLKTTDLINLNDEIILNICKILGVFLDNAIESVKIIKDKNINIELYKIDDELYIEITNSYQGYLDLSNMSKTKYTTKGKGHGYGLLLVNKIIEENKNYLKNEKRINGNQFTQTLIIKI